MPTLPFKLNQERRHHIPRQKHKVTNSAAYDAVLRQRGSLTVWFTNEAVPQWRRHRTSMTRPVRSGQWPPTCQCPPDRFAVVPWPPPFRCRHRVRPRHGRSRQFVHRSYWLSVDCGFLLCNRRNLC